MKKLLLGSTALVAGGLMAAPAMAADPIKIGVGGYYQFFALAGNIEGVYAPDGTSIQYKGLQFIQEGEIHFIGQSKLDNGTTVGLTVELEGWNNRQCRHRYRPARQIDEAFLFAFGDWGRIEFGSRDQASYRMYYGAPSALIGWGFFQHNSTFNWAERRHVDQPGPGCGDVLHDRRSVPGREPHQLLHAALHGPADRCRLRAEDQRRPTPCWRGLAAVGPGPAPRGICGFNDATTSNNCPTNDNSWQDLFDVGANYLNKFGDVTVALFGAFAYASASCRASTTLAGRTTPTRPRVRT